MDTLLHQEDHRPHPAGGEGGLVEEANTDRGEMMTKQETLLLRWTSSVFSSLSLSNRFLLLENFQEFSFFGPGFNPH